jgi:hypothetical protein
VNEREKNKEKTMRFNARTALALFACGAATACATASSRKNLGDVKVTAAQPTAGPLESNSTHFTFRVNEGRILLMSPGVPDSFDLTKEANGCLRGPVEIGRFGPPHPATPPNDTVELRQICPVAPASGDPAGLSRWRDERSKLVFTAQLSADGKSVIVQAGHARGEFVLGEGPAADELRKRPELLAAAFAYGYVPETNAKSDGAVRDYSFVLASDR